MSHRSPCKVPIAPLAQSLLFHTEKFFAELLEWTVCIIKSIPYRILPGRGWECWSQICFTARFLWLLYHLTMSYYSVLPVRLGVYGCFWVMAWALKGEGVTRIFAELLWLTACLIKSIPGPIVYCQWAWECMGVFERLRGHWKRVGVTCIFVELVELTACLITAIPIVYCQGGFGGGVGWGGYGDGGGGGGGVGCYCFHPRVTFDWLGKICMFESAPLDLETTLGNVLLHV
jgi:hypothetical protein